MKFKPITAPSATDLFVQQLKTAILSGQYQPGDKLPSERELGQQMRVSRPVINAGLKRLQRLHFVNIYPRSGCFIADYRQDGDLMTMNEIINFYGGHYRLSLLNSIYRVREQLEGDIIRLAAQLHDVQKLARGQFALKAFLNQETAAQRAECHFDFVHALAVASNNDVYPLLINNFKPIYLTLGTWIYTDRHAEQAQRDYSQLLRLIAAGNVDAAVKFNHELMLTGYESLTGKRPDKF